jgi:hypothetical protein
MVIGLVQPELMAAGFPPLLTFQLGNGRAATLVVRIAYDRKRSERREAARAMHRGLTAILMAAGYPPSRMAVDGMDLLAPNPLAERIAAALDPAGVIAPGRYPG